MACPTSFSISLYPPQPFHFLPHITSQSKQIHISENSTSLCANVRLLPWVTEEYTWWGLGTWESKKYIWHLYKISYIWGGEGQLAFFWSGNLLSLRAKAREQKWVKISALFSYLPCLSGVTKGTYRSWSFHFSPPSASLQLAEFPSVLWNLVSY